MDKFKGNKRLLMMYVIGRKDGKARHVENIAIDKTTPSSFEGRHNGKDYYSMFLYDRGRRHTQVIALDRIQTTRTEVEAASLGLLR